MDLKNIEKFPNKDRLVLKCLNRGLECVSFEQEQNDNQGY